MRILSMTATFGKLSNQTLVMQPGMNIIEAPNEWGKSTWCAFVMAMLYGIDTGSRTKAGFLADKEHYAPWSGEPMSGSMDILWQGREITIQRQNKGRVPFGEVKAFETHTGIPVPELMVAAPGQVLLGVERSVFARAGFLKLSEMPVTEDESLRRRLNELVTTGDESGASDALEQKLRDLKNKCRFNKKGLLPEVEGQLADVEQKLGQLELLQQQVSAIAQRQKALQEQIGILQNHKQALVYREQQVYGQKVAAAGVNRDAARNALQEAESRCGVLPTQEKIRNDLTALQQLRDTRDSLHTKAQLLPDVPQMPVALEAFRGKDPESAVKDAKLDRKVLEQLVNDLRKPVPCIVGGIFLAAGVLGAILIPHLIAKIGFGAIALFGIVFLMFGVGKQKKLKRQIADLAEKYRPLSPDRWEAEAAAYEQAQRSYNGALADRQQQLEALNRGLEENSKAIGEITGGITAAQYEETCRQQLSQHSKLEELQRNYVQAENVLQALSGAGKQAEPPKFEDTCTYTAQQTEELLSQANGEQQLLRQKLGQCQGQMESLGQAENLLAQKRQLQSRIAKLELHYRALVRAQEFVQQATQELQRRFAPRISQRTQELFAKLTDDRYQRLSLGQDLSLEVSAQGETTLHGTLWRSDGTVDQLYLALRLAVAEELTPEAPLVLDDAMVRFDDTRLVRALALLEEVAAQKQVILFTCQSREKEMMAGKE